MSRVDYAIEEAHQIYRVIGNWDEAVETVMIRYDLHNLERQEIDDSFDK